MTDAEKKKRNNIPWWKDVLHTTSLNQWKEQLFKNGFREEVSEADSYDVLPQDTTVELTNSLAREWEKELVTWRSGGTPHLYRAILRCYKFQIILFALLIFFEECLRIGQAVLVGQLIGQFEMDTFDLFRAYIYTGAICLVYLISIFLNHHSFHYGYRMRVALTSLIYRKVMRLPQSRLDCNIITVIMTAVTKGADIFAMVVLPAMYIVIGPLQLVTVCYLLWDWLELHLSGIAGLGVMLLLIPMQIGMGRFSNKLREKTDTRTAHRLKLLHTLLTSVYEHKMMVTERFSQKFINTARMKELESIRKLLTLLGCNSAITLTVGKIIMFVTFSIYVSLHSLPSARQIFTAFMLLETLRISVTILLPTGVLFLRQALKLLKNIQMLLMLDDQRSLTAAQASVSLSNDMAITFTNYTGFMERSSICRAVLMDVNLNIRKSKLYTVVGPADSGKSSLLLSVLGELHSHNGLVQHTGRLAYVSEHSRAFPGTIRDNILFGSEYKRARYHEVLDACDLVQSLELMAMGDRTLIGDQGMVIPDSLLVRIALARAVYQNTDIYLLDSIFLHMDEKTSLRVFNRCVCGLLRMKTRVLVTDNLEHVKASAVTVLMSQGLVIHAGSYASIKNTGVACLNFMNNNTQRQMLKGKYVTRDTTPSIQDLPDITSYSRLSPEQLKEQLLDTRSFIDQPHEASVTNMSVSDGDEEADLPAISKQGSYWRYFFLGSSSCVALIVFLCLMSVEQVLLIMCEWWLAYWPGHDTARSTAASATTNSTILPDTTQSTMLPLPLPNSSIMVRNVYIYLLFTILTIVLGIIQAVFFFNLAHFISKRLHEESLSGLINSPLSFFQSNTIGVLMSRFTRDTCIIDQMAPTYLDFMQSLTLLFGTLLMVSIINYWLFLIAPPIFITFLFIRHHFLNLTRGLHRTEIAAKSAVGSHVSSSVSGLKTIHTLGVEQTFVHNFDVLQDRSTAVTYLHISAKRWFGSRVDALGLMVVVAVSFSAILLVQFRDIHMSSALLGLSLVYAVNLLNVLQPGILKSSDVQFKMESVDRLLQCSKLPSESDLLPNVGFKPLPSWPMYGIITLEGLTVHPVHKGPNVLRNIWCCFRAQEKVGVLLKNKAEQQALINVFCRFIPFNGLLRIDGVDAATISAEKLRDSISFIPQNPPLFLGTLRQVLDPDTAYSDSHIWSVLTKIQISSDIDQLPHNIYTNSSIVNERLNPGHRQLICMTRALLKKSKIVIVEESSSNPNPRCQAILNLVTRTEFNGCTVLYMAQLPHTVIDFDRVMIIADGKIKEFDPPHILLNNEQSIFYKMSADLGDRELKRLKQVAQYKYENKPYVAPPMNAPQAAQPMNNLANSRDPNDLTGLPSFHCSRLVGVFNHLPTNKFSTDRL